MTLLFTDLDKFARLADKYCTTQARYLRLWNYANAQDEADIYFAILETFENRSTYTTDNLNSFINGYKTCALWSSNDDDGEPLDDKGYEASFATDAKMKLDCIQFLANNVHFIVSEPEPNLSGDDTDIWAHAGHDFWLTRNGHGAGFWDGDWLVNGDALTKACKAFDEIYLYINDDGEIDY